MSSSLGNYKLLDLFGYPDYNLITNDREEKINTPEACNYLDNLIKIGEGSYAKVYSGSYNNEKIAVKNFKKKKHQDFQEYVDLDVCSRILHPNINHVYTIMIDNECKNRRSLTTIMNFYSPGTLQDVIDKNVKVNFNHVRNCCFQGLEFLHRCHILHNDIKPENILYKSPDEEHPLGNAVIADFGLSTCLTLNNTISSGSKSGTPGTLSYKSPKTLTAPYHLTQESDVWALGITLASVYLYEDLGKIIDEMWDEKYDEIKSYIRNSTKVANYALTKLPTMFKYMIGERVLPLKEIMKRYEINRVDGTTVVETSDDLDTKLENEYLEAYNYIKKKDLPDDLYFATIHLIYISFKYKIYAPVKERAYFCEYIMSKYLGYSNKIPGSENFIPFRNELLKLTGGSIRTFNFGDYIRNNIDYKVLGKLPSKPLKYFSSLYSLTYKLPPKSVLKFTRYESDLL